ncbi:hypothetical protein [Lysobacter sp. A3-1-A15]|uniref:hypothetical protein n=1 Tax=Novilysobacter viscosus TaxID=3098602 RepID=UPI002EDA749A
MSSSAPAIPLHSTRAHAWLGVALGVWQQAPVRLTLVAFAPVLLEGLLQMVPIVGVVLSKLAVVIASGWALLVVDAVVRNGAADPARQCRRLLRAPGVFGVALLGVAVFAFQLLVCSVVVGPAQAALLATGQNAALAISPTTLGWVFASGLLPGAVLMFVLPLVVLDGQTPCNAIRRSIVLATRHWPCVAIFTAIQVALVVPAPRVPALLLLLLPFGLCSTYAIYRTVHARLDPDR